MNDPVPFTSSFASLQTEASRPERSEAKTQVWELFDLKSLRIVPPFPPSHAVLISQIPFQVQEDFENNFRPGFSQFGNFGQTTGRTVWGAPAEA